MYNYDIRDCFTSRYDDGMLIEADYSQLEIIVLAVLSGDTNMRADILSGIDMHVVRAAELFGVLRRNVTKEQRRVAKSLSFQLQYGAGAASMASDLGIDKELAEQFIANYYNRYPRVQEYHDANIAAVAASRTPTSNYTDNGYPQGNGLLVTETGRRFVFKEYDNPFYNAANHWSKPVNFSPTQIKNYPTQGYATGDIVPMVLGEVYHTMTTHHEDAKLINTIHDSIMVDSKESSVYTVSKLLKEVMERAPQMLKEKFNITFDLPLKVKIKVGHTWSSMKPYDLDTNS